MARVVRPWPERPCAAHRPTGNSPARSARWRRQPMKPATSPRGWRKRVAAWGLDVRVMRCGGWCAGKDALYRVWTGAGAGRHRRQLRHCCYIRCALPPWHQAAAACGSVVPAFYLPACPPSPRSRFGLYLDLIRWDRPPAGWCACGPRSARCGLRPTAFRAGTCSSCLCWAPSSCAARAAA